MAQRHVFGRRSARWWAQAPKFWPLRALAWTLLAGAPAVFLPWASGTWWLLHELCSLAWICRCSLRQRASNGARGRQQLRLSVWALALALADLAYALRHPATARYPYNYAADVLFIVAFVALALFVAGDGRSRSQPLRSWDRAVHSTAFAAIAATAALLQGAFVMRPMQQLACVPPLAHALAMAYSICTAVVAAQLLLRALRLQQLRPLVAVHGLLLMLAADFLCRHAALLSRMGEASVGELGWAVGLGLVACSLRGPTSKRAGPSASLLGRTALAPLWSVRTGLAVMLAGILPAAVALGWLLNLVEVAHAGRAGGLLIACWCSSLAANATALLASRALKQAAAQAPHGWQAAPGQARPPSLGLHEWKAVLAAGERLVRYGAMAAETAHDLAGPAAALEGAARALQGQDGTASARLLGDAAARVRILSASLLHARRAGLRRVQGASVARRRVRAAPLRSSVPASIGAQAPAGIDVVACVRQALHEAQLRQPQLALHCLEPQPQLGPQRAGGLAGPGAGADAAIQAAVGIGVEGDGQAGASAEATPGLGWDSLRIAGDARELQTALGHLLDNALEAPRKPRTRVRVRLRLRATSLEIAVVDTACGMDAAAWRRLQQRPLATTKPLGSGLGLPRVRRAARALGGRLQIFSRMPSGTTACLRLPLPAPPRDAQLVLVDDDALVRRAWQLANATARLPLHCCASSQACLQVLQARAHAGPQPVTWAFAVDDALHTGDSGRSLRRLLRAWGFAHVYRLGGDKAFARVFAGAAGKGRRADRPSPPTPRQLG